MVLVDGVSINNTCEIDGQHPKFAKNYKRASSEEVGGN